MEANQRFQPSQIVGLEHETGCLYAEVVQLIESRQSCWVRPLVLALRSVKNQADHDCVPNALECPETLEYHDLRNDSDLLLPLRLFQVALDIDVLPWLTKLYQDDRGTILGAEKAQGHQHLQEFVQQVWQTHPEVFRDVSPLGKP